MLSQNDKNRSYFAAANGYNGFRSYFNTVFNPKQFSHIYILKGGPGTGKSSLMKRVVSTLSEECERTETIFCSSDPSSLDGIILEKGKIKIAVLDGTSPHAVDPSLPGGCEQIINLGDFWDINILKSKRDEALELSERKRDAYRLAYSYLSVAGRITAVRDEIVRGLLGDCSLLAEKYIPMKKENEIAATRLMSAFGKGGLTRLESFAEQTKRVYCVGLYGSELMFLSTVAEGLARQGAGCIRFPSVFDDTKTEAIEIHGQSSALVALLPPYDNCEVIDTSRLLDSKGLSRERSRLEFLTHEREVMLWAAADEFKKASDAHFELEKIYTSSMSFDEQSEYINKLIDDISDMLSK